jgi:hypothetical protein
MIKHGSWMTQVTKTFGLLLALVLLLVGAAPVVGQEAAAQAAVPRPMTEEEITRSVWRLAWLMTRKGSKGPTSGKIDYRLLQGKVKYGNVANLMPPAPAQPRITPSQ